MNFRWNAHSLCNAADGLGELHFISPMLLEFTLAWGVAVRRFVDQQLSEFATNVLNSDSSNSSNPQQSMITVLVAAESAFASSLSDLRRAGFKLLKRLVRRSVLASCTVPIERYVLEGLDLDLKLIAQDLAPEMQPFVSVPVLRLFLELNFRTSHSKSFWNCWSAR